MQKTTKFATIEMMIGLPGSGKTTFAKELANGKMDTCIISVDDYKNQWEYRHHKQPDIIKRVVSKHSERAIITRFIIDGLFLTNDSLIENVISVIRGFPPYLHDMQIKLKLHYWDEDRETCLKNDGGRRETPASTTIQNAEYESINLERVNAEVGKYAEECEFELIPVTKCIHHTVILKDGWERYIKPFVPYREDGKLRSCKWCTGGTAGSCWDSCLSPVSSEAPYEFTELDTLLESICPNITFLHYKRMQKECVTTEESSDSDYYGGVTHHMNWVCDLRKLYDILEELGYIKD